MKSLVRKADWLVLVFFVVLILLGVLLGATGYSEKMLEPVVNEELRTIRISLAQTIRDPEELEKVMEIKREELRELYDLDKSWYQRLPKTYLRILTFDLGYTKTIRSFEGSNKVSDIVSERIPNTLILMYPSFIILAIIGVWGGVWLATRAGSIIDKIVTTFSTFSFCTPSWWVGILLILIFGVWLVVLPTGGMYSTPPPTESLARFLDLLKHAVLPVLTVVLVSIGSHLYINRSITIKVAQEPFILFAKARGLSENRIMWRHILRAASPTILTSYILGFVVVISGSILIETVFNWPGMGRLYYDAILGTPDVGLILALTFIYTLLYVVARFVLDVLYLWLDPRIRY